MQTNASSSRAGSLPQPRQVASNQAAKSQTHALQSLDALAVNIRYSRGQEICSPSRPAEYWYRVVSGWLGAALYGPTAGAKLFDLLPRAIFGFSDRNEYDSPSRRSSDGDRELPAQTSR